MMGWCARCGRLVEMLLTRRQVPYHLHNGAMHSVRPVTQVQLKAVADVA